jgi:hypothetical protein
MLRVSATRVARLLLWAVAAVTAAHLATAAVHYGLGYDRQLGLRPLFNLNGEANLPTWFSSALLLLAAGLLALIWRTTPPATRGDRRTWAVLAAVFLFLAADETAEIHEMLNPLRDLFRADGLLYWAWVGPYGIAGLVLLVACLRFLRRLPRRTTALITGAGALYVGGALVLEILGGYAMERFGRGSLPVVATYTVEELCEMLGLVLFVYALLDYLGARGGRIDVAIEPGGRRDAAGTGVP